MSQHWAPLEGGHPDANPVPNHHFVELEWFRTRLDVAYGFAPGWDVEGVFPFDVKKQKVRFETADGQPFENPQGLIHHREETLEGIGDLQFLVNYRPREVLLEGDLLRIGVGISLPTGEIEENPFELGDLGLRHHHIQFGTGTIDPVLRLGWSATLDGWSFNFSTGIQWPLYENRKGFRAPALFDFSIGPTARITDWLRLGVRYTGMLQGRGYWEGDADENTGFFFQGVSVSMPVQISPEWSVVPSATRIFSISTRGNSDGFEMEWVQQLTVEFRI